MVQEGDYVPRHALDVMRDAEDPLTARDITKRMLKAKGVTDAKPKAFRDLIAGVTVSLRHQQGKTVESVAKMRRCAGGFLPKFGHGLKFAGTKPMLRRCG